jgi:hypothetical protein
MTGASFDRLVVSRGDAAEAAARAAATTRASGLAHALKPTVSQLWFLMRCCSNGAQVSCCAGRSADALGPMAYAGPSVRMGACRRFDLR